jgi:uncharacterized protein (DUF1330 family)
MAAYLIADVEVTDPQGYEAYRQRVPAIIAAHGGRYLARGGATEVLEGDWVPRRAVVLEFPSREALMAFYRSPEYQPLIALRQRASNSRLVVVEGV